MKKLFYLPLLAVLILPACTSQNDLPEETESQDLAQVDNSENQEIETESQNEIINTTEPCISTFNQGKNFSEESRTQNVTFDFPCGWKINMVEDDGRTSGLWLSSPDDKAILFTTNVKFGEAGEMGSIEIDGESYKTTTYGMKNNEMGVIVETKFGNFSYSYYTEEQKEILENIVKSVQYSGGEINPF